MMAIIERMIDSSDKPRAEVIIDVQILEVNRSRARQYGLDLGNYAINAVFSPEADPRGTTGGTGADAGTATLNGRAFNANTITRGVSANDFYLAVPSAVIRFLETDSDTRVMAKPQLRGAEGVPLSLNLGEDIPVPSTTFTPVAAGGANSQPLTSFGYRTVGIIVKMTAHVTYEDEIRLELEVESSTLGSGINIAGQDLPSFGSRKVQTALRLREGEPSLLAGLLREDQRHLVAGFPGLLHLPIIKQLFSNNDNGSTQTDIVMLLTPRIVRTHELTPQDIGPIRIGTQSNLGLSGPPPLLAAPGSPAAAPAGAAPTAAPPAPTGAVPPPPNGGAAQANPPVRVNPPAPAVQPGAAVPSPAPATAPVPAPAPGAAGGAAGAVGTQGSGQIVVSAPPEFRQGGGPYTVPISITGASQISSVSLTVTYNPAVLRITAAQEGTFLRAGGAAASSISSPIQRGPSRYRHHPAQRSDGCGRHRAARGARVRHDRAGQANLNVTGSASGPNGAPVSLQFGPIPNVTVK
jgi:general secretion pathway protein D